LRLTLVAVANPHDNQVIECEWLAAQWARHPSRSCLMAAVGSGLLLTERVPRDAAPRAGKVHAASDGDVVAYVRVTDAAHGPPPLCDVVQSLEAALLYHLVVVDSNVRANGFFEQADVRLYAAHFL
jgi:hypothetical protein